MAVDLDAGEFSVHECAAVLKYFLSELKEPLLTDACYRAHCQVHCTDGKEISLVIRQIFPPGGQACERGHERRGLAGC